MSESQNLMEKIVSLCKRRGFVFQGSEIYGGLAGTWDYGPLGVALKKNIENLWWKRFVLDREDIYGVDAAILMNPRAWEASGHVGGFNDPLVSDIKTKKRYRADHLLEDAGENPAGMNLDEMAALIKEKGIKSPDGNELTAPQQFNMMFKTSVGSIDGADTTVYLRPETAGGMFVNFKNIVDTFHPKLPFGMAQIGKAFRNEIAPRDFIFRVRELEQMEIEYFVHPSEWEQYFSEFEKAQREFLVQDLGLSVSKLHRIEVPAADRAHYSKHSIDTEFDFPFGQKELLGLAYRTNFDLSAHAAASSTDLSYYNEETKERVVPHVIEPTFGLGRLLLALISDAYYEDEQGGESRVFLKFHPRVAPVKAAVFPLLKNKPELVEKAREVYSALKKEISQIGWDDNGNIGKRYRRQDEIGTPWCITIDFDTLGEKPELKDTVTVRDRDTGEQQRMPISELSAFITSKISL
jgi:glycyl-tRNA synthetase